MLGYVTAEKAELKMKEYELYSAYYCGICKSVGARYGQLPRLTLSYDFAFLALLLAALSDEDDLVTAEHCIVHPIRKKNIARENRFIDYAGDMMLILTYYKLKDDIRDERRALSAAASAILHSTFKKLRQRYDTICSYVEKQLAHLSILEEAACPSLDETGEAFAAVMVQLFAGCPFPEDAQRGPILAHLGRYLGKWIYIADAFDDLEKDIKSGAYNPLLCRFSYAKEETAANFRRRIRESVEFSLISCLTEMGKACDLLTIKKNKGIVENIIYLGLLRKTEQLLKKGTEENERSI